MKNESIESYIDIDLNQFKFHRHRFESIQGF